MSTVPILWEEIMLMLPDGFRGVAPDLRGYGDTEDKDIDSTRGMGDWVDDLLPCWRRSISRRRMLSVTPWVDFITVDEGEEARTYLAFKAM